MRQNTRVYCVLFILASGDLWPLQSSLAVGPAAESGSAAGDPAATEPIRFGQDIRPLLASRCYACHGPDDEARQAELRLDQREVAVGELPSGSVAIRPGDAAKSAVILRLTSGDPDVRMPPPETGPPLAEHEIELVRRWIEEGAEYERHWSLVPPARPALPEVRYSAWCRNEIDYFVLAKLEAAGLAPEPEADRYHLMRRLSLDLTGLPPSIEEVDAFVLDNRPDAYERLVERLLNSPSYGEHWARKWLDLARYADSQGYAQDEPRVIWPYRDWVIRAFNRDLPFDQFTIEQIAGDMLDDPSRDQLIATGFHRNTMTNTEGGTDDEEFRHAAIVDRVNTTMQVWMGMTFGCAQCHTHKYDPFTHEEYYRVFALLNQSQDTDQPDNTPTISTATETQAARVEELKRAIAELSQEGAAPSPDLAEDAKKLEALNAEHAELEKLVVQTPIMRELPAEQARTTHIHIRGAFLDKGEEVVAGTPAVFGDVGETPPTDRLEFARWLVSPDNPLTARVAVNRHWEQLFGNGIVETSEDFGTQGTPPTHPELLDWLAVEFMAPTSGAPAWSMKELCRLIVTSATYRQSSRVTREKLAADPANRLLSRGARFRLTAEQLRDQALSVSGLLSKRMFGPPVYPPKPKSGLTAAFGGSLDWEPSDGEDRYRRGLYTFWRRTDPYPSMMALDATPRTVCTVRRLSTNTPVGAFVTLNDPAFVECADALARRVLAQDGQSPRQRAIFAFRSVVARPPTPAELARLVALFELQLDNFRQDASAAEQFAQTAAYNKPLTSSSIAKEQKTDSDATDARHAEVAAWTVVANVLLNLDEALTKN
jgi:hypothetical protein